MTVQEVNVVNKIKYLLLLGLVLSIHIYAKPYYGNFKVVLEYKTKIDFSEKLILERKDKKIYLNNIILPSEKIIIGKNRINYLVMGNKQNTFSSNCFKGTYQFTISRGKTKIQETGCIGEKRFGNLLSAFKSI